MTTKLIAICAIYLSCFVKNMYLCFTEDIISDPVYHLDLSELMYEIVFFICSVLYSAIKPVIFIGVLYLIFC